MVLILISVASFCKPAGGSSDKSKQALFPLALLGSLSMSSEFDIPYATCEGAKEFTKESGIVTDETPANTIKYFKFNSTKTESLYFDVNPSTGNSSGSFCMFGFAQNQTVDNNSSIDTLETSSDYCVSDFSLTTTASSYRCIAVLALSSGGKFDLKTTVNSGGSTTTNTTTSVYDIKPDFSNPTLLADGQTTNEIFAEYSSSPAFKAANNYGGGKYFKFTIPANKTALLSISNLGTGAILDVGFYDAAGNLISSNMSISSYTSSNRSLTVTAGATSEDAIFFVGYGRKGITYTVNVTIQGKIEAKSFISTGLTSPNGIAVDASGNIYVADTSGYRVIKYNSAGVQQWSLGNGQGDIVGNNTVVKFISPTGIAVDTTGDIYISDSYASKIKKIDSTGTTTSIVAGSISGDNGALNDVPGTSAKFKQPLGITLDNTYLYVVDSYNRSIRRIRKSDSTVSLFAGPGTSISETTDGIGTDARFYSPKGIVISAGNLYITDNSSIRKINIATAEVTTITSKSNYMYSTGDTSSVNINYLQAITADSSGNLYVTANTLIFKVIPGGKTFIFAGSGYSGDLLGFGVTSKFNFGYAAFAGLGFDSSGNLFVADTISAKIKKIVYSP